MMQDSEKYQEGDQPADVTHMDIDTVSQIDDKAVRAKKVADPVTPMPMPQKQTEVV